MNYLEWFKCDVIRRSDIMRTYLLSFFFQVCNPTITKACRMLWWINHYQESCPEGKHFVQQLEKESYYHVKLRTWVSKTTYIYINKTKSLSVIFQKPYNYHGIKSISYMFEAWSGCQSFMRNAFCKIKWYVIDIMNVQKCINKMMLV